MTLGKFSHRGKSFATGLSIAGSLTLAACASDDGATGGPLAPTPIGRTVLEPARIHQVSLIESDVKPARWRLLVQYGLPGGCALPGGYVLMESFPHQVRVNIRMPSDPSRACTMIYGYGNYEIELGGGYEACKSYEVRVNGEPHSVKAISPLATCPAETAAHSELSREDPRSTW
jgi:hypothetical protein